MAVVAYAPASIGNVSVGFDVLGAALAPIDGSLLGDRVEVHAGSQPFTLECRGRFAHKLPSDPQKNIVYACYLGYAEALKKKGRGKSKLTECRLLDKMFGHLDVQTSKLNEM